MFLKANAKFIPAKFSKNGDSRILEFLSDKMYYSVICLGKKVLSFTKIILKTINLA